MQTESLEPDLEATLARVLALITAHARADTDCEREVLAAQAAEDLAALSASPLFSGRFSSIASRLAVHWRSAAAQASGSARLMH